ncbi:MAG TPA: valine--tRNA ligase, partial [Aurantimonas coralicida]|nr:valine--tRNA ligase [Aurantimonas coralicida]
DEAAANETRIVMGSVLDRIYALLHPFMPFMTEELWATTAETRPSLLCHAAWPSLDFADSNAADDINWLIAVVSEIRSVRAEMNVPPGAQAALLAITPDAATAARLDRHGTALKRLARLASIEISDGAPDQSAQIIAGGATFALPLAGMIDIAAEQSRLEKAEAKALAEIERIDRKLSNQKFVANAPDEVVEQEREKREAYRLEAEKLATGLERLR